MSFRRPGPTALARLAIAGILVYVALDVALVFLRPQFSVLHNAESHDGSAGSYAWVMDLNFLLRGAFSLAVARALTLEGAGRRSPPRHYPSACPRSLRADAAPRFGYR